MSRRSNLRPYPTPNTPTGVAMAQIHNARSFEELYMGRVNSVNDVALSTGTTTIINHPFLHENSVVMFMPKSAAAAALASSIWVTPGLKTATINHSSAAGGEAFSWAALG